MKDSDINLHRYNTTNSTIKTSVCTKMSTDKS